MSSRFSRSCRRPKGRLTCSPESTERPRRLDRSWSWEAVDRPAAGRLEERLSVHERRVRGGRRWLLKSWQNTPSITWEDRLVFIKVATEALTGEGNNFKSAERLRSIFERALAQEGEGLGIEDLLWSPGERTCTRRWLSRGNEKAFDLTQFVHWCCALGDARNSIVHGEAGTSLAYDELDSPYRGPFVEIGDRVVREAIAVLLGECGFPAVWRQGLARGHLQMYRALRQLDAEETADEGTGAPKDQGPVE